jgi:hypothetical protein
VQVLNLLCCNACCLFIRHFHSLYTVAKAQNRDSDGDHPKATLNFVVRSLVVVLHLYTEPMVNVYKRAYEIHVQAPVSGCEGKMLYRVGQRTIQCARLML